MRTIKDKVTWIDILKPNEADLAALKKEHAFHPIILDELLHPSSRPRVEEHSTYLFLVYHLPVYDQNTQTSRRSEIDFLITRNKLITIHYEPLEHLDAFFQSLLRDEKLRKKILGGESFVPLYYVLEEVLAFSSRQLRHVEDRVSFVAEEIFNHKERDLLKKISYIKRDILDYRLIARPQEELLESLVTSGQKFWGEKSKAYLNDLLGDTLRTLQNLENYFEIIESLDSTNAQLLEAETNAAIKRFTVLAFLFSVPLFFIFLSEIEYIHKIFLSSAGLFWFEFFLIAGGLAWLTYYFKKKDLL